MMILHVARTVMFGSGTYPEDMNTRGPHTVRARSMIWEKSLKTFEIPRLLLDHYAQIMIISLCLFEIKSLLECFM